MNIDDIINCVKFHVRDYDKPYFEILGDAINLTPWGFIEYASYHKVPLKEVYTASIGKSKYEYQALVETWGTHLRIVWGYFESHQNESREWELLDSIIKLLRRDD
jgi:hypothetical protein